MPFVMCNTLPVEELGTEQENQLAPESSEQSQKTLHIRQAQRSSPYCSDESRRVSLGIEG